MMKYKKSSIFKFESFSIIKLDWKIWILYGLIFLEQISSLVFKVEKNGINSIAHRDFLSSKIEYVLNSRKIVRS